MYKVLIVEDDSKIAEIIGENIRKWGMEAQIAGDFSDIYNQFLVLQPHLVLLDITLPSFDGFHWCRLIRQVSQVPILFLSSRNTNMDIIMAVNMGADDFITKPFSLDILLTKVNALLRRAYSYTNTKLDLLEYQGVSLHLADKTLQYRSSYEVEPLYKRPQIYHHLFSCIDRVCRGCAGVGSIAHPF